MLESKRNKSIGTGGEIYKGSTISDEDRTDNRGIRKTPRSICPRNKYRDEIYSLRILLSRTQAGPGRTVKEEQEQISPNHIQKINLISVFIVREIL